MGGKENDGIDKKLRNPQAFISCRTSEPQQPQTEGVVKTTLQVHQREQAQGYGLALIWLSLGGPTPQGLETLPL